MNKFENIQTREPKEQASTKLDFSIKPKELMELLKNGEITVDFNTSEAWGKNGLYIIEGDYFPIELNNKDKKIIRVKSMENTKYDNIKRVTFIIEKN